MANQPSVGSVKSPPVINVGKIKSPVKIDVGGTAPNLKAPPQLKIDVSKMAGITLNRNSVLTKPSEPFEQAKPEQQKLGQLKSLPQAPPRRMSINVNLKLSPKTLKKAPVVDVVA